MASGGMTWYIYDFINIACGLQGRLYPAKTPLDPMSSGDR